MTAKSMRVLAALATCTLLFQALPQAGAVPKPDEPARESPAEKCRKALEQTHSFDFNNMMLTAAIDMIRDRTRLNIVMDRATLAIMGISPEETPVTLKLDGVKVRTVLKTLLSQFKLTYVIDQEIILVTSEENAIERQMQQRVSFDFDQVPLDKALKQLSRETNTNLVLDPRFCGKVKESVTLKLEDVPLEAAVRLLAEMAGLRSVRQSNVLFITTKEVAADLRKEEEAARNLLNQNPAVILDRIMNGR